jgi:hypothetical protein
MLTPLPGITRQAIDFGEYAGRQIGTVAFRFNRRVRLDTPPQRLLAAAVAIGPRPEI